ncbi:hypothetical protein ACSBR2_038876 [Camellia fascicularis]
MVMFGITDSTTCVLCEEHDENHNHLFFDCSFSQRIWQALQANCNVQWPQLLWNSFIEWFCRQSYGGAGLVWRWVE